MEGQATFAVDLDSIFTGLKSKNESGRIKSIENLYRHVSQVSQEVFGESYQKYLSDITHFLATLLSGHDANEKITAILTIERLIDIEEEPASKILRYAGLLRMALPSSDPHISLLSSKALGKLCSQGGSASIDLVDTELTRSIEWVLHEKSENRRHGAILVIYELLRSVPSLLVDFLPDIFDCIWATIFDTRVAIRVTSTEIFGPSFQLVASKAHSFLRKDTILEKSLQEIHRGFKLRSVEGIHGAVLLSSQVFNHRDIRIKNDYESIMKQFQKYKDHKDLSIKKKIIETIPIFCSFDPTLFLQDCSEFWFSHLLYNIKKEKDKAAALEASSKLFNILGTKVLHQAEPFIFTISDLILKHSKNIKPQVEITILQLISSMVVSLNRNIAGLGTTILDLLFTRTLSPSLYETLTAVSNYLPKSVPIIQNKLLEVISKLLFGKPFQSLSSYTIDECSGDTRNTSLLELAIQMIGNYNFGAHDLSNLLWKCSETYLYHDVSMIRIATATSTCQILQKEIVYREDDIEFLDLASLLVEKLLKAAVSDPIMELRISVIQSFVAAFDCLLIFPKHIEIIFLALNDESFDIQNEAVKVLGRLCDKNPAYILPPLRRALILILNTITISQNLERKKNSARLLALLIQYSHRLIYPYTESLFSVLMPPLKMETDEVIVTNILFSLGELFKIEGDVLDHHIEDLFPLLIKVSHDPFSSDKKEAGLVVMTQLIRNTGYVVQPILTHSSLLNILRDILLTETQISTRKAAIRLFGTIGAVDPYFIKDAASQAITTTELFQGLKISKKDFPDASRASPANDRVFGNTDTEISTFPVIIEDPHAHTVVSALLEILNDPSLSFHHAAALRAIVSIFKFLGGQRSSSLIPKVIETIKLLITLNGSSVVEFYYQQLTLVIYITKHYVRAHLQELTELICNSWGEVSPNHLLPVPSMPLGPVTSSALPSTGLVIVPSQLSLRLTLVSCIQALVRVFDGEYRPFATLVIPKLLIVLDEVKTQEEFELFVRIVSLLLDLSCALSDYIHLILPNITRILLTDTLSVEFKYACLEFCSLISQSSIIQLEDHASKIVPPLLKLLQSPSPDMRHRTLETLSLLAASLGKAYLPFVPLAAKSIAHYRLIFTPYHEIVQAILLNIKASIDMSAFRADNYLVNDHALFKALTQPIAKGSHWKLAINQHAVRKSWSEYSFSQIDPTERWMEWARRFSSEILRESPYHSLRACGSLASSYPPLAKKLFNSAFISIWPEMIIEYQRDFLSILDTIFNSDVVPADVVQLILGLAEYYEHIERELPFTFSKLAQFAFRHGLYAKALRYRERELATFPPPPESDSKDDKKYHRMLSNTIESLISINNELQLPDAAIGILHYAEKQYSIPLQESWYEKLQRWDEALESYESKLEQLTQKELELKLEFPALESSQAPFSEAPSERSSFISSISDTDKYSQQAQLNEVRRNLREATFGSMRCLHALGDWNKLAQMAQECWPTIDDRLRADISPIASTAAWGLGEWDLLDMFISSQRADTADGAFFRAILSVQKNRPTDALLHIDKARELLDLEITPFLAEGYTRAYTSIVRSQMLAEIEEIVDFKNELIEKPEKQAMLKLCWERRLENCEKRVDIWQRFMKIRSLVVPMEEDITTWTKFGNLCRKQGRPILAEKIFLQLLHFREPPVSFDNPMNQDPHVIYSYVKLLWSQKKELAAFEGLGKLIQSLVTGVDDSGPSTFVSQNNKLIAKFLIRYASYRKKLYVRQPTPDPKAGFTVQVPSTEKEVVLSEVIQSNFLATRYDPLLYKAWHRWAISNFEAVSYYEKELPPQSSRKKKESLNLQNYIIHAVEGFLKSISLSKGISIQDTLRLLTIWFKYGSNADVHTTLQEKLPSVPIETWLQVIPQLIARIYAPNPQVRRLIHHLLLEVGKEHPQAIIYSLTVASKSVSTNRQTASSAILDKLKAFAPKLVDQALVVSKELIRVAILWHEMWHTGLEEASRLYYGQKNIQGMFAVLEPLHQMLEKGPETLREISFHQNFVKDLNEAYRLGQSYRKTGNSDDVQLAWDIYYQVFKKISKMLQQISILDLQYCSPALMAAQNLELAIPGTYRAGEPIIHIKSFNQILHVINSKQRPRRLSISGDDGKEYPYLLKGHEDLRQDERVMQLFGLVNSLLGDDRETLNRHLNIQKYPVIPLSPNSGLIGWIPHCDTLHTLIRDYREAHGIPLNVEHRLMLQMAPDYDHLTILQKMEAFQFALDHSSGGDLGQVLWLRSSSAETWLERRTNYTKSLAVMSMAGYILGLGDRHPSNLMISRDSGKVIHIDFGDCFEVAVHREKFPEKIPFRLTRMLVKAMEIGGIEGTYRIACEHTMRVLRENKDSLMAVLEAFVYDPLISWRLFAASAENKSGLSRSTITSPKDPIQDIMPSYFRAMPASFVDLASGKRRHDEPEDEDEATRSEEDPDNASIKETLNAKALSIISRVSNKLTGRDFNTREPLKPSEQVSYLIQEASSVENLCQCYIGWCPFW